MILGFSQIFWFSKLGAVGLIFTSHSPDPALPHSTELLWLYFSIKLPSCAFLYQTVKYVSKILPLEDSKAKLRFNQKFVCEIHMWNLWSQQALPRAGTWGKKFVFQTWRYIEQEGQTGGQGFLCPQPTGDTAHHLCPSRSTKASARHSSVWLRLSSVPSTSRDVQCWDWLHCPLKTQPIQGCLAHPLAECCAKKYTATGPCFFFSWAEIIALRNLTKVNYMFLICILQYW